MVIYYHNEGVYKISIQDELDRRIKMSEKIRKIDRME
jgi:hypothetical protein